MPGVKPKTDLELLSANWNTLSVRARRRRVLLESNYACSECAYNRRRADGHSVIEIDHIDGDNQNNTRENLRALCPNCHAMTPNFRAFGRSNKMRSSTVPLRPGNREYRQIEELLQRELPRLMSLSNIQFSSPGWTLRLRDNLQGTHPTYPITSQLIGRFMKKHAAEFYSTACYHVAQRNNCEK